MIPLIHEQVNLEFKSRIINSYLSFEDGDSIFCILYDWTADQDFLKFENRIMNHDLFKNHEDYGENCLYKFNLSSDMLKGRDLLINNKHSEFSSRHKKAIENYIVEMGFNNLDSILRILDPKDEKGSVHPNMYNETFINHLKVIRIKIDNLYEGNKKKWSIREFQPQQDNIETESSGWGLKG